MEGIMILKFYDMYYFLGVEVILMFNFIFVTSINAENEINWSNSFISLIFTERLLCVRNVLDSGDMQWSKQSSQPLWSLYSAVRVGGRQDTVNSNHKKRK